MNRFGIGYRETWVGLLAGLALMFSSCGSEQQTSDKKAAIKTEPAVVPVTYKAKATVNAGGVTAPLDSPETKAPVTEAPAASKIPLKGAILPNYRIVAFYGNPLSKRMGILGELPPEQMLAKLKDEVKNWEQADTSTKVIPALHLIAITAQGAPGKKGMYRQRMPKTLIDKVIGWAEANDALIFLDVQVGRSTLQAELPRLAPYLRKPNVHLGIDPEFAMGTNGVPGRRIGTFDAADVNFASKFLADLTKEHDLPPKMLVVHRFTQRMVTNYKNISLRPEVQIIMDMDGWGRPVLKKDTYRAYIAREPVQYTGFKLFYHNDVKLKGSRMMTPAEVLALKPKPMYIQYQ